MAKRKQHDQWYKKLFSNPTLVRELLCSFVKEDFVRELDFTTLKRVDKSFISDEYKEREADVLYEVRFRRKRAYVYLLVEFQSTVDRFMALRVLAYVTQFYMMLVEGNKPRRLPPVFPIVLYNGDKRWDAPVSFRDLVEPSLPANYVPDFRYYKIAENEFSKRQLVKIRNAVSALFYVENSTPEEFQRNVSTILSLLKDEGAREFALFANWVAAYLRDDNQEKTLTKIHSIEEATSMWATAVKKYGEKIYRKASKEGEARGEARGEAKGEAKGEARGMEKAIALTAQRAAAMGLTRSQIAEITGLAPEVIDEVLARGGDSVREKRRRYRTSSPKRREKKAASGRSRSQS